MKRPFVWFTCGLIVGILSAAYLNNICFAAVLIAVTAVSVIMGIKRKVYEHFYIPLICILGFFVCSAGIDGPETAGKMLGDKDVYVSGIVRSYYVTDSGSTAINLDAKIIVSDEGTFGEGLRVFVTAEDAKVSAGDIIHMKGRMYGFDEPDNPYQMNYKMYMLSNGYDCSMWAASLDNTGARNDSFVYLVEGLRENVNEYFDSVLPEDTASVLKALTTGYKHDIDDDTRERYKNLGISHLLAVSGIHVSVIAGAVFLVLTRILKGSKRKVIPFAAAVLVLYLFFTGVSPSAFRAVMMTIVLYAGYMIRRDADRLNVTAFVAFVMLFVNPLYLWNISFQLSCAGITAVGIANDMMKDDRDIAKLSKALMFSLLVWIMTTPLTMYYFGGVSIISPLTNLILVPYISFATGQGLLAGLMSIFAETNILVKLSGGMIYIYNAVADAIGTEAFYIETSKPSLMAVAGFYVFMLAVICLRKNRRALKKTSAAFVLTAVIYCFCMLRAPAEIVFFDAGQGDASAVYVPGKVLAVIDGGPDGGGERAVIPYIEAKGGKADVLFISHTDSDHSAGAMEIMEKGLTETVVMPVYADTERALEIAELAREKGIMVIFASAGDRFELDGCTVECLYPFSQGAAESENDNSLVLKFSVNNTDILFTGDISGNAETELLKSDIKCDIIKIAHHGSDTSSTEGFLRMTGADTAVIEAEEDNIYGFPDEEVMARLEKLGINTYITGRDGAVVFYAGKDGISNIKTYGGK